MDHLASIINFIQDQKHEMIALLEKLVLAESPTLVPESQAAVLALLSNTLEEIDYGVINIPGKVRSGGHLYARPNNRNRHLPAQLLVGHCDTVWPIGTLKHMPFIVEGNVIRGPGVYDMKGGLVQSLFALRALKALNLQPGVVPIMMINSDEEIGSPESSRYIRRLSKKVQRAFVMEPALGPEGKLKTTRKGAGRFEVQVTGQSAHAGLNPDTGASAILELSHVIQRIYELNDKARGITLNVGQIEGGVRPNVVAPTSKAVIDVRVKSKEDGLEIEKALLGLKATTPNTTLKIEGRVGRLPMAPTPENRALWKAARDVGARMGLNLEEGTAGGVSDGNTISQYAATLDGVGAVGDGAHAAHEFLYIDKMMERTILLAMLLMLPQDVASNGKAPFNISAPMIKDAR